MAKMLIEIEDELKDLGEAMKATVELVRRHCCAAKASGGKALDYGALEREMGEAVARVERGGHRAILRALDIDRPAVQIEGKRHTRVGRYPASYYTMAGSVEIERSLYRPDGQRKAKTADPVSLRAGVVGDGWLPATARAMAHTVQQQPSRETEASAREIGRLPYSRSAFEDVVHAVGKLYEPVHVDVKDALISRATTFRKRPEASASRSTAAVCQ